MPDQIATGIIALGEDFLSHRITGEVTHAPTGVNPWIDVPLISRVPVEHINLWQGGCLQGVKLPDGFDFVLSLYDWERYTLPDGCERLEVRMYDSLQQSTEQVDELAQIVVDRLEGDQTVLVHCQAGLNRSGLITARALTLMGYSGRDAIKLLRDARSPLVLCNQTFANWLEGIPGA